MDKTDAILNQFKQETKKEAIVDTGKRLRIGFIGTGGIAEGHIKSYLKMPDVELVGGADLVPGRAEAFFESYGVEGAKCYTDYKAFLDNEDLDAVSICTYNRNHAPCAVYALERGVHVLLENPCASP